MRSRRALLVLGGLTVLAAVLRVPGLDSALWFDEIVTLVQSVRPPLVDVVTAFPGNNNHPFYSLLAHLSIDLFGEHNWALRLPAVVFGVVSVPLLYGFARRLVAEEEALLASALLAVSYHHIWFSQNARGYTMLLALTIAATWLFHRFLGRPAPRLAVAYGLAVGLGIYTHLTMALVGVAHALIWLWWVVRQPSAERGAHIRGALIAVAATGLVSGLLYLPMVGEVFAFFSAPKPEAAEVASSQWALGAFLSGLRIGFGEIGVLAALLLLAVGGLSYLRSDPLALMLFALPGVTTAASVVALHRPMFPRFFFLLLGFGMMVLVRGALDVGRFAGRRFNASPAGVRGVGVGLVALVIAVSLASLPDLYRYPKQDFDAATAFIEASRQPGDAVGAAGLAIYPVEEYFRRPWTRLETRDQFDALRREASRTWVVYSLPKYMARDLVESLREHCVVERDFPGTLGDGEVTVCATRASP